MKKEIKAMTVSLDLSLVEVIKQIDKNACGIVYVLENEMLRGSITDGDVRRYLLNNLNLNGEAKDVMNDNPKFINRVHLKTANDVMRKYSITSLPIVDDNEKLIDIRFLMETDEKKSKLNLPVVIMAGGKGTRLYPYTQILPKPLIPINKNTISELIMEKFEEYGCDKFSMIVNYKKEFIKAFFRENEKPRNITFFDEIQFLGTAGGLKLLENSIDKTFFMNNCDIIIEDDYAKMIEFHKINKNIITLICALKKEVFPYGTIEADENNRVLALKEKPKFEFLTNTGLYIIEPEFLSEIPENTFIHITDVIENCIKKGLKVGVYEVEEENWMDMGQLEELEKMKAKYS